MAAIPQRFEIWLINLDPTIGSEIRKTRPCLIVSPKEMNNHLATLIIAPLTSTLKGWPMRVATTFEGQKGEVALDQIRTIDRHRLIKRLGVLTPRTSQKISEKLVEMFAY